MSRRPKGSAQPAAPSRGSRRAWLVGGLLIVVVAIASSTPSWLGWLERRAVARFLPNPAPALQDAAPAFAERLRELDSRARFERHATAAAGELARLYDANWRTAEAIALYTALADQLDRDQPRWPYALARLLGGNGDLTAARQRLEQTIRLQPGYLPARLKLADVLVKLGEPAAARSTLDAACALEPSNPHSLLALARLESSDRARAENFVRGAIDLDPQFSPAWSWLAEQYTAAGRLADAAMAREKAASSKRPTDLDDPWEAGVLDVCYDPNRLRVAAAAAATSRRLERASTWIEHAAELAPRDPAVQRERGRIWRAGGDWPQARRCFALAAQLEPGFADNWANLHEAELRAGDPAAASRSLDEGLRLHPQSPGLHLAAARRAVATGRTTDAVREYRDSIRLRPQEAIARIELASLLFKQDAVAEGIAELRAALDSEPDHPLALSTLAYVHIGLGDEAAARRWLARARHQSRLPAADLAALELRFREQFHTAP